MACLKGHRFARTLRREASAFDQSGLPQCGQAFQQGLHRCGAGAGEGAGDFGGGGFAHVLQGSPDGGDLVGQAGGPGGFGGGCGGADGEFGLFALGCRVACGVLIGGAQPADFSTRFFRRADAVQGDGFCRISSSEREAGQP